MPRQRPPPSNNGGRANSGHSSGLDQAGLVFRSAEDRQDTAQRNSEVGVALTILNFSIKKPSEICGSPMVFRGSFLRLSYFTKSLSALDQRVSMSHCSDL